MHKDTGLCECEFSAYLSHILGYVRTHPDIGSQTENPVIASLCRFESDLRYFSITCQRNENTDRRGKAWPESQGRLLQPYCNRASTELN
jgi:hypothetical protein